MKNHNIKCIIRQEINRGERQEETMLPYSKSTRGFTLVELMIVLTMLAIMVTVGAPSFSGFIQEGRVKSGARAVAISIQTARLKAINANRRAYIDFAPGALTPADSFYTIWLDMDADLTFDDGEADSSGLAMPDVKNNIPGFALALGVCFKSTGVTSGPDGLAIAADGVDFGGSDAVSFNGRGEASSPGVVYLTGENGSIYSVTVTSLGAVRTFRWEDNTWK